MKIRLHEMRWPEVKEVLSKPNVVILPIGSVEQHGRHLPVNVDSAIATYVAERSAEKVVKEHGIAAIVAPTIDYADISVHKMFPGTIGVKVDTLIKVISDVLESFIEQGFKNIVALSGHWENRCSIESATRFAADRHPEANLYVICTICIAMEIETSLTMIKAGTVGMGHALETETSLSLVIQPQNVNLKDAGIGSRKLPLSAKHVGAIGMDTSKGVLYHPSARGFEETGTYGDPTKATRELGEKTLALQINNLSEMLVEIVRGVGESKE